METTMFCNYTLTDNTTSADSFEKPYLGSVLWIVVNSFIILMAILGNILTMSAILFSKKLRSLIANQFVFSLAVSDLLVGLSIPYHMAFYLIYEFGSNRPTCLLRFVLLTFACASSIWNLLLIATDRYIAIVYPLHYIRYMTRKVSALMIAFVWLVSFSMASVLFYWNEWCPGIRCEITEVLPDDYMNFIVTPMFVAVWLIIFLLYARICREASGHSRRIRNNKNFQTMQVFKTLRDSRSIKVMLTILGCFSICWLPFFVETLYARISNDKRAASFYEISFTLAVSNSGMNPIIYAWKNSNFRKAFSCLVRCQSPNTASTNQFVTNHVPSKKNSLNGVCNGTEEDFIRSEVDIEMHRNKNGREYSAVADVININVTGRN